jgi:transposase
VQLVQLLQRSKVTPETLRKWVKQFEIDNGDKTGVTTAEQEEIKRLKKEVLKL